MSCIANAGLFWAWRLWDEWVCARLNALEVLRLASLSLMNSGKRKCFNQWWEHATNAAVSRARLGRCLRALNNTLERKGFTTWYENAYDRCRIKQILRQVFAAARNKMVATAFRAWFEWIPEWLPVEHSHSFIARREGLHGLEQGLFGSWHCLGAPASAATESVLQLAASRPGHEDVSARAGSAGAGPAEERRGLGILPWEKAAVEEEVAVEREAAVEAEASVDEMENVAPVGEDAPAGMCMVVVEEVVEDKPTVEEIE